MSGCQCKIGGGPDGVCFDCQSRAAFHERLKKLEIMTDDVKKVLAMVPQGHKADHAQWPMSRPQECEDCMVAAGTTCANCRKDAAPGVFDAEPARTAAAVAAAREEQRQLDSTAVVAIANDEGFFGLTLEEANWLTGRMRRVTLTATPLADRIAEVE